MDTYTVIAIKFIMGTAVMILQINLLGKVEFAVNTPLNQIQNYVLGGIIGGVIYNKTVTILQFVIVLLIWSLVVAVVKFLRDQNRLFRRLIEGRPVILIHNGLLDAKACLRVRLSADQLMAQLRSQGIATIDQVKSAVMEQSGHLTILENSAANLRFPLIADGQVNADVLEILGRDENWLVEQLGYQGITDVEEVFLAEYAAGELKITSYPPK